MSSPVVQQRRLQYRADARRSILDAAEALMVESGSEGFSMRRLAERCGLTAPTLYHYFKDKPSLIDALLEERVRRLIEDLRVVALSSDPVENVIALGSAFANFGIRNPNHYQLLVMNRGSDAPDPPSTEEVQQIFGAPLDALVERGDLAEGEIEALRQGLWSFLHGDILLQASRPDHEWIPQLLDRSLRAMIHGSIRTHPHPDENQQEKAKLTQ
jgi:AcrR family transcriptional regulator